MGNWRPEKKQTRFIKPKSYSFLRQSHDLISINFPSLSPVLTVFIEKCCGPSPAAGSQSGRAAVSEKRAKNLYVIDILRSHSSIIKDVIQLYFSFFLLRTKLFLHFNGCNYCMEIWTDIKGTGSEDSVMVYWATFELIWSFHPCD